MCMQIHMHWKKYQYMHDWECMLSISHLGQFTMHHPPDYKSHSKWSIPSHGQLHIVIQHVTQSNIDWLTEFS